MAFTIKPNKSTKKWIEKGPKKKTRAEDVTALDTWVNEGGSSESKKKVPHKTIVSIIRRDRK
jgi:ribosomal protein L31E